MTEHPPSFMAGGGLMGELLRSFDWAANPLGPQQSWPQPLKTLVGLMLGSNQPMFIAWGESQILLYNDAYMEILAGKHPALGRPFLDVWSEIRENLVPIVTEAFAGRPVHMDDITLMMLRRGYLEEAHFAFSYTPVRDEAGSVNGFYCACTETTAQVHAERQLRESEARLRSVIDGMAEGFILLDKDFRVRDINSEGMRLETRPRGEIIGKTHWEAWPGTENSELGRLYQMAMAERRPVSLEHRYTWPDGQDAWLDMRAYPAGDGLALFYRDVTERRRAENLARESAERIELALDSGAIVGTWVWDVTADRFVADQRFANSFGLKPEACARGLSIDEVARSIHADDRDRVLEAVSEAMQQGGAYRCEYRVLNVGGQYHWVEANGRVEVGADGRPERFPGVLVDIEDRHHAQTALRESEARLRVAQAAGGIGTFELLPESGRVIVSDEFCRLWGVDPVSEADVRYFLDLVHPSDRERIGTGERVLAEQALAPTEYRIVRPDTGDVRWIARRGEAVRDENSGVTRYLGVCYDITDRKQAQDLLQELNATLEHRIAERTAERDRAWRNTQDLLVTVDSDGILQEVNPAWTRTLGYTAAETVGRTFLEFIHPDDVQLTTAAVALVLEGPIPPTQNRYRSKDGSYRWISWIGASEGDLIYASGRDITAEKQAAHELSFAQEALRQSQKMEAMGQLTGGVAHDFNNLLTPIIGSLDFLQQKKDASPREQRLIEGALQSAERARTLVHRLLAFARRQPLQPTAVNVAELIEGIADLVDSTTGPDVAIKTKVDPDIPAAMGDANQLEMAILNLAVNARDAMPDGGTIRIGATAETLGDGHASGLPGGDYVRISIQDTGVGMDEETLARAVEPFFSTKGLGRGTGLGLSMVHGLTGQLGGALTLTSAPGKGTTADLWLQIAVGRPVRNGGGDAPATSRSQTGTVLLVDDEALVRASAADMLSEIGMEVVEAGSALEALEVLSNRSVDLIVTDHLMPGMSGTELAAAVAARSTQIPVLIISGYADIEGLPAHLPRLTKPFRRSDLAACIGKILEE